MVVSYWEIDTIVSKKNWVAVLVFPVIVEIIKTVRPFQAGSTIPDPNPIS